jgi:hypothetical protein
VLFSALATGAWSCDAASDRDGLVGRPAERLALVGALERAAGGGLVFRPYPSALAARTAIDQQAEYGALVLGPGPPRLLLSSASGASVARVLEQAAARASQALGEPIPIVDRHPLPPGDPSGLAEFYDTAATVVGAFTMFQLGRSYREYRSAVAADRSARGDWRAGAGACGGACDQRAARAVPELWYALGVRAVAALISSALIVLIGRWAIIPTWLLLIVLGNTSAGGAVAPPLLPPLYAFVGRFLPPGATVNIIRTATYFRHDQHAGPFVVQVTWLVCALAALLISAALLERRPGRPAQ